jgi:hypothetical protein
MAGLISLLWAFIGFAIWANACGVACGSRGTMSSEVFMDCWAIVNLGFPFYLMLWAVWTAVRGYTHRAVSE